jgi:polysaccharide biosynthesis/export protein
MPFNCVFEMSVRMKKIGLPLFFLIIALSFSLSGRAQQSSPASPSAIAALQAFEGTGDEEYRLGCGDQISVMVVGHAEATGKQIVGPDGIVTLPYAGGIKVLNLTRDEAAKEITTKLTPFYRDPSVVVGVDVYSSNNILILGAVAHPGLMQLDGPATLLSVMTRAGMSMETSSTILGKSTGVPERVAIFRENRTIIWTDFKELLEDAKPELQMRLRKNDVVYVPSPHERYVSIFGEVVHPGLVDLQDGATLVQLLAESGGIVTDRAGRYPKIQIIHEFTGSIQTVDYADILQSKKIELHLEDGDIIYVPQSKFERVSVTFVKISPLLSIATLATLLHNP